MASDTKGYREASLAADLLALPVNSLAAYAVGAVLGGLAGMVAGRIVASVVL